jgi:hypothetical protein
MEVQMTDCFRLTFGALAISASLATPTLAQDVSPGPVRHRGAEAGIDVLSAARTGEIAFYVGAFERDQMVAVRFGARDETDSVPCSAGAMYEYVLHRASPQMFKLTAGGSFNRVFSCATGEEAALRPSPGLQSTATLSAGIRVLVFNGRSMGGSLKVMGYIEGGRGHLSAGDVTSKGIVVGVAFHGR